MALTEFTFNSALKALGAAQVFVGNPFVSGGMANLGAVEGDMGVEESWSENPLTAELTGGAWHQAKRTLDAVTLSLSLVLSDDPTAFAKISPAGTGVGGGWSKPQKVQETTVLLVPEDYLPLSLNTSTGVWTMAGSTGDPKGLIWLWRATPTHGREPRRRADGGKVMLDVSFRAMFDATKPEGHKLYTRGDPIVNASLSAATFTGI